MLSSVNKILTCYFIQLHLLKRKFYCPTDVFPIEHRRTQILESFARKVCKMFVYKHTETIEYVEK